MYCNDPVPPPVPTLPIVLPPFITPAELSSRIFDVVVTAISDGDTTLMPQAIAAAQQEVTGYLSRYDFVTILSQVGAARDPLLILYMKDMAVWHFIPLANPNIDYEVCLNRYKFAIRWLEKIQDGKFVPPGWPLAIIPALGTFFHLSSRDKRGNNY